MSGDTFQWTQLNVTDGEERHLNGSRDRQASKQATKALLLPACEAACSNKGRLLIGLHSKFTAYRDLISMLCESKYGGAEVGSWLAARRVVGVLYYERVSGTCLELLSAGKVVFCAFQRLSNVPMSNHHSHK